MSVFMICVRVCRASSFSTLVTIVIAPALLRLCYSPDGTVGEVAALTGRSTVFCPSRAVVNTRNRRPTAAKRLVRRRGQSSYR
jgi:hypothetical protein